MTELVAKPIVKNQFWIVTDGNKKVGNIEANNAGYGVQVNGTFLQFNNKEEIKKKAHIKFENLDTNSISGNVFSSISDFGATPSSTKVVSPSVLTTFLTKPSDIGTVTPGNAYFKELGFANIASANIASVSDIQTGTSNSTVLTPSSFAVS